MGSLRWLLTKSASLRVHLCFYNDIVLLSQQFMNQSNNIGSRKAVIDIDKRVMHYTRTLSMENGCVMFVVIPSAMAAVTGDVVHQLEEPQNHIPVRQPSMEIGGHLSKPITTFGDAGRYSQDLGSESIGGHSSQEIFIKH